MFEYYKDFSSDLMDVSVVTENSAVKTYSGSTATAVTWSAVYYNNTQPYPGINSALTHYFMSLGVSPNSDILNGLWHPYNHEWYPQSNYLLVGSIDSSCFDHKMLGNEIRVELPHGPSGVTTYCGALYANSVYQLGSKSKDEKFSYRAGGPMCWLFNNAIIPYSGAVYGGALGNTVNANSAYTNWTSHQYAINSLMGTSGFDTAYGFVLPDRGIVCLMNVDQIISSGMLPLNMGSTYACIKKTSDSATWAVNTSGTCMTNVTWTGGCNGSRSTLEFKSSKINMKHTYFCVVSPNEFNFSTNPTWDRVKANSDVADLDDIYITEIALCNEAGTVIAYGKTSEPVRKNRLETLTFKVELVL